VNPIPPPTAKIPATPTTEAGAGRRRRYHIQVNVCGSQTGRPSAVLINDNCGRTAAAYQATSPHRTTPPYLGRGHCRAFHRTDRSRPVCGDESSSNLMHAPGRLFARQRTAPQPHSHGIRTTTPPRTCPSRTFPYHCLNLHKLANGIGLGVGLG